jgi:Mn-dependent DtxR family transcriptional regulator
MRRSAEWMVLCDERILEYLSEHDSGTPTEMKESGYVRWSRPYISQRAQKLADEGLLQHLGNGVYIITDEGDAYLDEEYDAEAGRYIDRDAANADPEATDSAEESNHG